MLTIRAMADGKGYSARHLEHSDYYAEGERVTGRWCGRAAELLGLQGDVRQEDFEALRQGLDPATGVPGLYWITFFSDEYATWLGLRELPKELVTLKELAGGGVSLKFCESPDDCRSLEVLQKQRAAIEWLGPQKFFDIRFSDRKLDTPNWDHAPSETGRS